MIKHKTLGQVFTPDWIVEEILNAIGFCKDNVFDKKIIDPACGDGAFLKNIVARIIEHGLQSACPIDEIKKQLETNIYGIEIDPIEFDNCLQNLNEIVKNKLDNGIKINWQIFNENTLHKYKEFLQYFDFVVGNPPYIRIHNLDDYTKGILKKEFTFSQGTIDIYISFFELGFKLLNKKGILGYITPNSYLHNASYKDFRKYLKNHKAIQILTDFKANKIFHKFSTYAAITIINFFDKPNSFIYKELIDDQIEEVNQIKYSEVNDKDWSFSSAEEMDFLKTLYSNENKKISDFFDTQYGFATLRDGIFIAEVEQEKDGLALFNNYWIEKQILYKIVKGSTYKGEADEHKFIIYPYTKINNRYVVMPEDEIQKKYPYAYRYLLENKEELLKRDIDKGASWYEFGRSQGIQNSHKPKIVLSTLMKDGIKFHKLDEKTFVYSGIFIIQKDETADWQIIEDVLKSQDFFRYIRLTGKDFSGGYKSISTKQIKSFPTKKSKHLLT